MIKNLTKGTTKRLANEIRFFEKHGIEQKTVVQSAKEVGISLRTAHVYKKGVNYRQMALAYLEDSTLGGVNGTMSRLIKALNAERPHNIKHKTTKKDGSIVEKEEVVWVADNNTQDKALKKVIDIFGLNAPKTNVSVAISISSDADLFSQIDDAQRECGFLDQYEEGESGFELVTDPQSGSSGNFKSRKRALLQGATISE